MAWWKRSKTGSQEDTSPVDPTETERFPTRRKSPSPETMTWL